MAFDVKNIAYFRNISLPEFPDFGAKLFEALQSIGVQGTNIEQQTNSNAQGAPQPPQNIDSVNVSAANGHFSVAIQDQGNNLYRGVQYFVEHDSDPNFTNPITVPMGTSRNANLFLGNVTRYFRAFSAYPSSPRSQAAYHGSQSTPQAVLGGGTNGGPPVVASEGSGTGPAGVGLQGPGDVPFRGGGVPPAR